MFQHNCLSSLSRSWKALPSTRSTPWKEDPQMGIPVVSWISSWEVMQDMALPSKTLHSQQTSVQWSKAEAVIHAPYTFSRCNLAALVQMEILQHYQQHNLITGGFALCTFASDMVWVTVPSLVQLPGIGTLKLTWRCLSVSLLHLYFAEQLFPTAESRIPNPTRFSNN